MPHLNPSLIINKKTNNAEPRHGEDGVSKDGGRRATEEKE